MGRAGLNSDTHPMYGLRWQNTPHTELHSFTRNACQFHVRTVGISQCIIGTEQLCVPNPPVCTTIHKQHGNRLRSFYVAFMSWERCHTRSDFKTLDGSQVSAELASDKSRAGAAARSKLLGHYTYHRSPRQAQTESSELESRPGYRVGVPYRPTLELVITFGCSTQRQPRSMQEIGPMLGVHYRVPRHGTGGS